MRSPEFCCSGGIWRKYMEADKFFRMCSPSDTTARGWDGGTEIKQKCQKEEVRVQRWQMKKVRERGRHKLRKEAWQIEKRERTCEQEVEKEQRVRKRAREEVEKFHHCCVDVGGRQRVGRFMGEKNAEGTGSWLSLSLSLWLSSHQLIHRDAEWAWDCSLFMSSHSRTQPQTTGR